MRRKSFFRASDTEIHDTDLAATEGPSHAPSSAVQLPRGAGNHFGSHAKECGMDNDDPIVAAATATLGETRRRETDVAAREFQLPS